jgi:hypothetical protein
MCWILSDGESGEEFLMVRDHDCFFGVSCSVLGLLVRVVVAAVVEEEVVVVVVVVVPMVVVVVVVDDCSFALVLRIFKRLLCFVVIV